MRRYGQQHSKSCTPDLVSELHHGTFLTTCVCRFVLVLLFGFGAALLYAPFSTLGGGKADHRVGSQAVVFTQRVATKT